MGDCIGSFAKLFSRDLVPHACAVRCLSLQRKPHTSCMCCPMSQSSTKTPYLMHVLPEVCLQRTPHTSYITSHAHMHTRLAFSASRVPDLCERHHFTCTSKHHASILSNPGGPYMVVQCICSPRHIPARGGPLFQKKGGPRYY